MSSDTVFVAVEAFLKVTWTATPLAFENEPFAKPSPPAAFVAVEMFGDFYDAASIGAGDDTANLWRETGQILLHVFVPRNTGSRAARQHAKALADLFRGLELAAATIRFPSASIGAGAVGDDDGNWWRLSVDVAYEADD